jgi:uncharacterized cupredoxin-like copper-binding protein
MNRWALLGAAAAVAILATAFVACGGGGKSGGAAATATEQAVTTPTGGAPTAVATEPGGTTPEAGAVTVNLTEYIVSPQPTSVAAGSVTFNVKNIGGAAHQFMVIKTDAAPDALPTNADGSVNEDDPSMQFIDEIEDIAGETDQSLTVSLEAGNYVLICNLVDEPNGEAVSHYARGMHTAFTVTG